ncbi:glycosyltransferase [Deminuibacter soli]|uniref:Glycosyltransferase n=1 Tax=Deminuibacter soli TaxID=2291815 RepID=A0A3E1NK01_9BACT|nr:glycosyltransferase [Deminuibacter soli]RFM28266.1 glycosyltransferase [Deminuibacter soli]
MNSKQHTLVILAPAFPADETDSAWVPSKQLFVQVLKKQFPSLHIEVLTFNYPYHTHTYYWQGATVTSFNGMHARKLQRAGVWMRVWQKLRALRKRSNIIGLFSFWCGECALVGSYFGKLHHIPHYCWVSGQDAKRENRLVKLIRPGEAELVTISRFLTDRFYASHAIRPQHLIPIGIDATQFAPSNGIRDIDILGAGSLIPLKQYAVFISAVKQLQQQFPGIKAVLCGGGAEQERLQAQIDALQLQNNITITGMLHHHEVLQYMQRSKVFLHPSAYEGFGAVCLEAMYAGCQVISFTDPMYLQLSNWHIVQNESMMVEKAAALLHDTHTVYQPFLLYSMSDSVKAVMRLFQYAEPA